MTEKTLSYQDLLITPRDVFAEMGYRDSEPDDATRSETVYIINNVKEWLRPRFAYTVVSRLPGFSMGRVIECQLRGAQAYAVFVCTSGCEFEDYQRQLMHEGDMVRVFIADSLGTLIAERCADRMEQSLQASIDKLMWHRTNRFSPGYCGWYVSEQQMLFR